MFAGKKSINAMIKKSSDALSKTQKSFLGIKYGSDSTEFNAVKQLCQSIVQKGYKAQSFDYANLFSASENYLQKKGKVIFTASGRKRKEIVCSLASFLKENQDFLIGLKQKEILTAEMDQEKILENVPYFGDEEEIRRRNSSPDRPNFVYLGFYVKSHAINGFKHEGLAKEPRNLELSYEVHRGTKFIPGLNIKRIMSNAYLDAYNDYSTEELVEMRENLAAGKEFIGKDENEFSEADREKYKDAEAKNVQGLMKLKEIYYKQLDFMVNKYGGYASQLHPIDFIYHAGTGFLRDFNYSQDTNQFMATNLSCFDFNDDSGRDMMYKRINDYFDNAFSMIQFFVENPDFMAKDYHLKEKAHIKNEEKRFAPFFIDEVKRRYTNAHRLALELKEKHGLKLPQLDPKTQARYEENLRIQGLETISSFIDK